ncbi:putative glycyl endopeptidase [Helianthus anomalus]
MQFDLVDFASSSGAIVSIFRDNVTHVIAATDSKGAGARTYKLLMAKWSKLWLSFSIFLDIVTLNFYGCSFEMIFRLQKWLRKTWLRKTYWKIFREWKVEHGKSYPTADEEKRRFETFQQNLHEIEAHNSGPDAAYYTKGLNPFSDMIFEQFKLGFLMHESVDDGLYDSETDEEDVIHQSKYYYPFKPNDH